MKKKKSGIGGFFKEFGEAVVKGDLFVKLSLVVSEISCIIRSKSKTFEVIRMRKLGKLLFQRVVLVALFY